MLLSVGREENEGAPLFAPVEKWAAGWPAPEWTRVFTPIALLIDHQNYKETSATGDPGTSDVHPNSE